MTKETAIKLFEQKHIRSLWKEEDEKCHFSIIDVIEVLTGTDRPRKYWSDLKAKLQREGSELSEKIGQLDKNKNKEIGDKLQQNLRQTRRAAAKN